MNYSASERYQNRCRDFDKRQIKFQDIRKRWFKNHYVLYQTRGIFSHNCFTFSVDSALKIGMYPGKWYGPFWNRNEADDFARTVERTHANFVLG